MAALGISRGLGDDWLKLRRLQGVGRRHHGHQRALFFEPYDHDPGNKGYPRHVMYPEGAEGAALCMKPASATRTSARATWRS